MSRKKKENLFFIEKITFFYKKKKKKKYIYIYIYIKFLEEQTFIIYRYFSFFGEERKSCLL